MADDMRYYETFYGVHINDFPVNFGAFNNHRKLLVKDYVSEGCSTTETSAASATNEFLYPQHIKKTYFIEGVIVGHITLAASSCTSTVTSYRVTLCKVHENTNTDELFSTGWITVNDILAWDAGYSIGDEMVYPFWIDAWQYEKITEKERLYLKVETNSNNCTVLWHSNDATWEDIKIEIPLRM